jgi:uncharacterized caspase-like protein
MMPNRSIFRALILGCTLWLTVSSPAFAKRVALVIGNSAYTAAPPLPNPGNDADDARDAFAKADFDVVHVRDADLAAMRQGLDAFIRKVTAAGREATALVFYAGHAVQFDGANYLLPVDLRARQESDIPGQALSLDAILERLDATPAATKIVVLDACRDNPFGGAQGGRGLAAALVDEPRRSESGLARVNSKGGALVAFSTSPGATAADGAGRNSPYTQALLAALSEPGVSVEEMFRRVRVSVWDSTAGRQLPWEISSLTTRFAFVEAPTGAGASVRVEPAPPRPTAAVLRERPAAEAYRQAIFWNDPAAYRQFLEAHPDDPVSLGAHRTLSQRQEEIAFASAARSQDAETLRLFQRLYPGSRHSAVAVRLSSRAAASLVCAPPPRAPARVAPTRASAPSRSRAPVETAPLAPRQELRPYLAPVQPGFRSPQSDPGNGGGGGQGGGGQGGGGSGNGDGNGSRG